MRDLHRWICIPRHAQIESSAHRQLLEIRRPPAPVKVFGASGIARAEYEILDPQQYSETTSDRKALLIPPTRVGPPSDLAWDWTRRVMSDSSTPGDVLASEWPFCIYDEDLRGGRRGAPESPRLQRRCRGKIFAEFGFGSNWGWKCAYNHARNRTRRRIARSGAPGKWRYNPAWEVPSARFIHCGSEGREFPGRSKKRAKKRLVVANGCSFSADGMGGEMQITKLHTSRPQIHFGELDQPHHGDILDMMYDS